MTTHKKILFFVPSLNIGGIERVFITYANALASENDVMFLICHPEGKLQNHLDENISLINLNCSLSLCFFKLKNKIKELSPEIIITGGDIPNALIILVNNYLKNYQMKVYISQHNYLNVEERRLLSGFIYSFLYNQSNRIISVSNGIKKFLINYGVKKEKIQTIYNPLNLSEIDILASSFVPDESDYFLYVGRISKVKNMDFLLRSFLNYRNHYNSQTKLIIIGDGDHMNLIKEYIENLDLQNAVLLKGQLFNPYPYIKNAKLVLQTSFSEALPTILLESLCLGITVVSTPNAGAIEILSDGKYGYISKSFINTDEFSDLIFHAVNNKIDSDLLKNYAKCFDIKNQKRELQNLLELNS